MIYGCRDGKIINFERFTKIYCVKVFFKEALPLRQPLFGVCVGFGTSNHEVEEFKTEEEAKSFISWLTKVVLMNSGQVFGFEDFTNYTSGREK